MRSDIPPPCHLGQEARCYPRASRDAAGSQLHGSGAIRDGGMGARHPPQPSRGCGRPWQRAASLSQAGAWRRAAQGSDCSETPRAALHSGPGERRAPAAHTRPLSRTRTTLSPSPPPARPAAQRGGPRTAPTLLPGCAVMFEPGAPCYPQPSPGLKGCCPTGFACNADPGSPSGRRCAALPATAQSYAAAAAGERAGCAARLGPGGACGERHGREGSRAGGRAAVLLLLLLLACN